MPPENEKPLEPARSLAGKLFLTLPGMALCAVITLVAVLIQKAEEASFGHPYFEAIVIAILMGMAVRTVWEPAQRWRAGIAFCAKQMLEIAVALLGASITFSAIAASGGTLLGAIVVVVVATIGASYGISRALGLQPKLSMLIACGNSICGNSAIAAVAPVIGASNDDVVSSISFTAILGVIVVLGLPLLIPVLHLTATQYGALAGMTVYAVPQVLAATVPAGLVSTQVGTLVKLVRVMMLGPLVAIVSIVARSRLGGQLPGAGGKNRAVSFIPWFIAAFLALAALRSISLVPDAAVAPIQKTAAILTVLSMAALGLGVDLRMLGRVGGKVTAAVTLSLFFLFGLSLILVRFALPS